MARVMTALRAYPGVADAVEAAELARVTMPTAGAGKSAKLSLRQAAALSYFPGRSGDLLILTKPNWIVGQSLATTHGSTHDYDQKVPLVFHGAGIKAGVYDRPASPADVAPTLAALVGVTLAQAEGTVLPEVIRRRTVARQPARTPAH
jgi:arylsulfatase A-like enzyme